MTGRNNIFLAIPIDCIPQRLFIAYVFVVTYFIDKHCPLYIIAYVCRNVILLVCR